MALATAIPSPILVHGELREGKIFPVRKLEIVAASPAYTVSRRWWAARPTNAIDPQRKCEFITTRGAVAAAATDAAVEVEKENGEVSYENMAREMENASPLAIVDKALQMFGNDIAIAFRWPVGTG